MSERKKTSIFALGSSLPFPPSAATLFPLVFRGTSSPLFVSFFCQHVVRCVPNIQTTPSSCSLSEHCGDRVTLVRHLGVALRCGGRTFTHAVTLGSRQTAAGGMWYLPSARVGNGDGHVRLCQGRLLHLVHLCGRGRAVCALAPSLLAHPAPAPLLVRGARSMPSRCWHLPPTYPLLVSGVPATIRWRQRVGASLHEAAAGDLDQLHVHPLWLDRHHGSSHPAGICQAPPW